MGKTIAVVNQKGGVGKTTTCINFCCSLHDKGKRVLLCDTDPQGNSTAGMGIDKNTAVKTVYDVLINGIEAEKAIIKTPYGDVMPSNTQLAGAVVELVGADAHEFRLKRALEPLKALYDYIIIDCPPSLEMLTLGALCAADMLLVPVQCEYFALVGLSDLITTLRIIKKRLNPTLEIEGVLLTMYDGRTNLSLQVAEEVRKYFKTSVFRTVIPRNVRLSEAPSHGKPAIVYDSSSRGSRAYMELADEFLANQKRKDER
jgi:chromosome partitioning protein